MDSSSSESPLSSQANLYSAPLKQRPPMTSKFAQNPLIISPSSGPFINSFPSPDISCIILLKPCGFRKGYRVFLVLHSSYWAIIDENIGQLEVLSSKTTFLISGRFIKFSGRAFSVKSGSSVLTNLSLAHSHLFSLFLSITALPIIPRQLQLFSSFIRETLSSKEFFLLFTKLPPLIIPQKIINAWIKAAMPTIDSLLEDMLVDFSFKGKPDYQPGRFAVRIAERLLILDPSFLSLCESLKTALYDPVRSFVSLFCTANFLPLTRMLLHIIYKTSHNIEEPKAFFVSYFLFEGGILPSLKRMRIGSIEKALRGLMLFDTDCPQIARYQKVLERYSTQPTDYSPQPTNDESTEGLNELFSFVCANGATFANTYLSA